MNSQRMQVKNFAFSSDLFSPHFYFNELYFSTNLVENKRFSKLHKNFSFCNIYLLATIFPKFKFDTQKAIFQTFEIRIQKSCIIKHDQRSI
jgi:hypothetical protein